MNTAASAPRRRLRLFLSILAAVFFFGLFCLASGVLWVVSSLRLSGDARALRNSLFDPASARWDKKIEVNVGWLTVKAAQQALRFSHLNPEERDALGAIRTGQVGVYELKRRSGPAERNALLSAADHAMAGRGWERLAGVLQPQAMVAVYVRQGASSTRDLSACFVVMEREQLVVGSGRGDLQPLLELAARELEKHGDRRLKPAPDRDLPPAPFFTRF